MPNPPYLPIFQYTRGAIVESIQFGAIAVATPDKKLFAWYGDPGAVTFLRSTAKPFQALPFIESQGNEIFHLTLEEIALLCASHSGTDRHKEVLESLQAKTSVRESDLQCGVHYPLHKPTAEAMAARGEKPTPNRHNCSGKHTGMIALARLRNAPYGSETPYIDPSHPIQVEILEAFAQMCNITPDKVVVGIDGCSAPNFAIPLLNTAYGYARLCDPKGLPEPRQRACQTIVKAMTSYPYMVGGPDSFDTELMEIAGGKIVSKGGAEGFQGIGILPGVIAPDAPALGIAFKISDGDARNQARSAVALEILRQLNALSEEEMQKLSKYGPSFPLYNFRKLTVGLAAPVFTLYRDDR